MSLPILPYIAFFRGEAADINNLIIIKRISFGELKRYF
jgi:hypothetical protein